MEKDENQDALSSRYRVPDIHIWTLEVNNRHIGELFNVI